jgi:hypothetical protein
LVCAEKCFFVFVAEVGFFAWAGVDGGANVFGVVGIVVFVVVCVEDCQSG